MTMYEEHILEHYKRPRNRGTLIDADVSLYDGNISCGDKIHVSLKIRDGKIVAARQECTGCAISTAGASMLFENVEGQTVSEILTQPKEKILAEFGSALSVARVKCALLGYATLRKALINYETRHSLTKEK